MKLLLTIALFTILPNTVLAHGDHAPKVANCSKECTKEQVENAIPASVEILVNAGRIEAAWTTAKIDKVEKKYFKKGAEWVAVLVDDKLPENKKRRYIFITTKGYLNGSNTTGE